MHTVIIGGGISGLAAAWTLRQRGKQVTLLESRPYLGGRLTSHAPPGCLTPFDNGPHLFLNTYTQTRRLLREMGLASYLEFPFPGGVALRRPDGRQGKLTPWPLLAPLGLAVGLLTFSLLTWSARVRAVKAAGQLLQTPVAAELSAQRWLADHSQKEERQLFWEPLIQAALNAPAEAVPVQHLRVVLKEGFTKGFFGGRLGYATQPLKVIFGEKVPKALEDAGVRIFRKAQAVGAEIAQGKITAIRLKDGGSIPCDGVIAALPPWALAEWLKGLSPSPPDRWRLSEWKANPIATVYLWGENRPWLEAFTCLPGRQAGWIFDYVRLWEEKRAPIGVILAEEAIGRSSASPLQVIFDELFDAFPQLRQVEWRAARTVQERRATPLRPPSLWGKVLPQTTALSNLLLAGDWLDPELPPTVEAGVRVGVGMGKIA